MTLEQIAQQAMNYLDNAGVAAEYDIENNWLTVQTVMCDKCKSGDTYSCSNDMSDGFIDMISTQLKLKSPA